jgi:hypothetical protein
MIYLTTVWDMYLLLFIQRGSDTIESIVCMQTMRDSCIRKYNLYMNMNGTEMLLLVLHVHQNPIIYWIVFKSNQVEYWRAARRDNTQQQKFEQTTICTFFIYIYFFTFSSAIGIQFQMIFSFSCCCLSKNNLSSRYHHTDIILLVSRVR